MIFLSFSTGRHPTLNLNASCKGNRINDFTLQNLIPLAALFGTTAIKEAAFRQGHSLLLPDDMRRDPIPWEELCTEITCTDAHDLLSKMLDLDEETRITAKDALQHAFFDEIRADYERPDIESQ